MPSGFGGWLAQQLGVPETSLFIKQIAGDASPRRYFRVARTPARKEEGGLTAGRSEAGFEAMFADSTHMDDLGSPPIVSETVIESRHPLPRTTTFPTSARRPLLV